MKNIKTTSISSSQKKVLEGFKNNLFNQFKINQLILFGSMARFETDSESDIDILVLTPIKLNRPDRHKITDFVFEFNLKHNTNFSTLVVDDHSWQTGPMSILPIKKEIMKDGILL